MKPFGVLTQCENKMVKKVQQLRPWHVHTRLFSFHLWLLDLKGRIYKANQL